METGVQAVSDRTPLDHKVCDFQTIVGLLVHWYVGNMGSRLLPPTGVTNTWVLEAMENTRTIGCLFFPLSIMSG